MLPRAIPLEAMASEKLKIYPLSWTGCDGTPGRVMSTGNPIWWEENRQWLTENAKQLKLNEEVWKKKAEKSKKDAEKGERTEPFKTNKSKMGFEDYDWVCVCRPVWDVKAEANEKDEDEESLGDPCGKKCKTNNLIDQHPGYIWIRTMKGTDRFMFWFQEQLKREPNEFDMHIYEDFSGYGQLEILQNAVRVPYLYFQHLSTAT